MDFSKFNEKMNKLISNTEYTVCVRNCGNEYIAEFSNNTVIVGYPNSMALKAYFDGYNNYKKL